MNVQILTNIDYTFSQVTNGSKIYIATENDGKLKTSTKKDVSLFKVFKRVQEALHKEFENKKDKLDTSKELSLQIEKLDKIKKSVQNLSELYLKKTNTWLRTVIRVVNYIIPSCFLRWLPAIFSAEFLTKRYSAKCIEEIDSIAKAMKSAGEKAIQKANEKPAQAPAKAVKAQPLPPAPAPKNSPPPQVEKRFNVEEHRANVKKELIQEIADKLTIINKKPIIIPLFNSALIGAFEKLHQLFSILTPNEKIQVKKDLQLEPKLETALDDPSHDLEKFLNTDHKLASEYLADTSYGKDYQSSLNQYREGTLTCRTKPVFSIFFKLTDGTTQNEKYLDVFNGTIRIDSKDIETLKNLLSSKAECKPSSIAITFEQHENLTLAQARDLISLSKHTSLLKIWGPPRIDFKQLSNEGFTKEEMGQFINCFSTWVCPSFEVINDVSHLTKNELSICLKKAHSNDVDFLLKCLKAIPDIKIPVQFLLKYEWDFKDYSTPQIELIVPQLFNLNKLELTTPGSQNLIQSWINQKLLNKLTYFNGSALPPMSMQVLTALDKLPLLKKILIPEIPNQRSTLSTFDNPFTKKWYIDEDVVHPIVRDLYQGPTQWASYLFLSMPLEKMDQVFRIQDEILDPHSISLWLDAKNEKPAAYTRLKPQKSVLSLIADQSPLINDENLIPFISKFPQVTHLSLYNCPGISNVGIKKLFEILHKTKIKTIDLTDCSRVTDAILTDPSIKNALEHLDELILSGTSVSEEEVEKIGNKEKVKNELRKLTFTKDYLEIPGVVENVLNSRNLQTVATLDFGGCTNLTDEALGLVLDRLNADVITGPSGELNPRRLNITKLNLRGCTGITDKAFLQKDGRTAKILNFLDQVICGHTEISDNLKKAYKQINFTDVEVHSYLDCDIDSVSKKYGSQNLGLTFSPSLGNSVSSYPFNAEILYAQSSYFRKKMRPAGDAYGIKNLNMINQHATKFASQAVIDLMLGKQIYSTLKNVDDIAHIAELVKKECLGLSETIYQKLLGCIYNKFDLINADKILMILTKLDDKKGIKKYETFLHNTLETNLHSEQIRKLNQAAITYGLNELIAATEQQLEIINQKLISQLATQSQNTPDNDEDEFDEKALEALNLD